MDKKVNYGKSEAAQLPIITLAYIGDAVFEIMTREFLIRKGIAPSKLHRAATGIVSAEGQFEAYKRIGDMLSEEEKTVFMRGRNADVTAAKKKSPVTHSHATGLEALFGFLYLTGEKDRLYQLYDMAKEGL